MDSSSLHALSQSLSVLLLVRLHGRVTGLTNYRDCGNGLKIDLVTNPELLEKDINAARSAAWFYASKGCLKYTDDLVRITQIINGGQNGINDRRVRYAKAKAVIA
nr:MAG TPA: putative chitinase [Caudoviricetes sp.]